MQKRRFYSQILCFKMSAPIGIGARPWLAEMSKLAAASKLPAILLAASRLGLACMLVDLDSQPYFSLIERFSECIYSNYLNYLAMAQS